jgi:hypothetical protein
VTAHERFRAALQALLDGENGEGWLRCAWQKLGRRGAQRQRHVALVVSPAAPEGAHRLLH